MRRTLVWIGLSIGLPAVALADDLPSRTVRDAVDRDDDALWSWVNRLDGEVLPEVVDEEREEAVVAELSERAFLRELHGLDVPSDYYNNPLRVLTGDPLLLDQLVMSEFDLPIVINEHVEAWMRILLGRGRGYFKKWLERKGRYEDLIYAELDAAGLPRDLIYLSMIESGFNAHAESHAAAGGLWQFIPSTGRMYGLEQDFWLDERRDPEMSTKAALQMLGQLNKRFGDWYLAFAAYNTGPARVARAMDRAPEGADYWTLLDADLLHRETAGYVPKIIAAAIIGHHPERYGFTDLEPHPPLVYDGVYIEDAVDVSVLAACAGITEEEFRLLNPMLRRYAVPDGGVDLRVPVGTRDAFLAALDAVPADQKRQLVMHQVTRGESLSTIASRYGVSMSSVVTANKIRNPNRLSVGDKLVIPMAGAPVQDAVIAVRREAPSSSRTEATRAAASVTQAPSVASAKASPPVTTVPATYTVQAGDALSKIAERFGVSMADLQRHNGLSNASSIQVGQVLRLKAGEGTASAVAPEGPRTSYVVKAGDTLSAIAVRYGVSMADIQRWNNISDVSSVRAGRSLTLHVQGPVATSDAPAPSTTYTVRSGDTLSGIAAAHGVSMSALQRANGIRDASSLKVGQRLKVPGAGSSSATWTRHTVKSGESLGLIANQYGCSVTDLKAWNDLKSATIFPGDVLKVRTQR